VKKIDIHCHADMYTKTELEAIFADKEYIVVGAATGYDSGNRLLDLAQTYPNLRVCLGIHPEMPQRFSDFDRVAAQIEEHRHRIVAIGEVGMPWYCLKKMESRQKEALTKRADELLKRFVGLARKTQLPVILHAIEGTASIALDQLIENGISKALFHWFEGNQADLERIIDNGYCVSISPDILHNRQYADFTDNIPLEILTLESDGPWEYGGVRGVPSMIEGTAAYLAEKRHLPPESILTASYTNSMNLFGKEALGTDL